MKNSDYWQQRFSIMEDVHNRDARRAYSQIEEEFQRAQQTIQNQINTWYARFADNNDISLADARKWLDKNELAEFRWSVNEYIRYGRENAANSKWVKELENASARMHISRLQALQVETQNTMEVLYGNYLDRTDSLLRGAFTDGYERTAFEIQKGYNVGWKIAAIDRRQLDKVMHKPWTSDGRTFSERIWGERGKLISDVQAQLTQNLILGRPPDTAIKTIAHKMHNSRSNAGRLVMTESAYFSSVSQQVAFQELGVEEYEIVATLDEDTSEICRELDGKRFPMKDYQPGVTAPPFHPWCRSVTVPAFDDDYGRRAASDVEGKTYYVPANTTYSQWKEKFEQNLSKPQIDATISAEAVNKLRESGRLVASKEDLIKGLAEFKEHVEYMEEPYKSVYSYYAETTTLFEDKNAASVGYDPYNDRMVYGKRVLKLTANQQPANIVFGHELAHRYDNLVVQSWKNIGFISEIQQSSNTVLADLSRYQDMYDNLNSINPAYQDILSALSKNKLKTTYKHDTIYWTDRTIPMEIFANASYLTANHIEIPEFEGLLDGIFTSVREMFKEGI